MVADRPAKGGSAMRSLEERLRALEDEREIRDLIVRYRAEILDRTIHHISSFTNDIEGDVAHCESYVITTLLPRGSAEATIGTARYIDRMERRSGEWRFGHRKAVMDFMITIPTAPMRPAVMTGSRDGSGRSYARPLELTPEGAARMRQGITVPGE